MQYLIKNINDIKDDIYKDTYKYINTSKKLKIDTYKSNSQKKRSILGEYLLNILIKDYFDKEIIFNKNNKPYIKNSNIFYNISHSGDYVIVVISNKEIGVDIQKIKKVNSKVINKIDNSNTNIDTIKLFNIKEAILKAYGLSIANIKDIDINDNNINITNLDNLIDGYYITIAEKK